MYIFLYIFPCFGVTGRRTNLCAHTYSPLKDTGFVKLTSVRSAKVREKTGGETKGIKFPILFPLLPNVWMDSVGEEKDAEDVRG